MKRVTAAALGLVVGGTVAANAADPPQPILHERVPVAVWTWTGLYAGTHVGGGFGRTQFTQQPPTGSIYGDTVRSPMAMGGAQLGYNWQMPGTGFVLGVEADASVIGSDGTNTCLASSGSFISANCHVRQSYGGTIAARAGYALGEDARTLLFLKSGVAALNQNITVTTNGVWPIATASTSSTRVGWTAGAGVERAITPAWSVKLEYDYMDFGSEKVATPASYLQAIPGVNAYFARPGGTVDARHDAHAVKLGVNLKLGADSHANWPLRGAIQERGAAEIEVGTRVWYSFGRHQKDLGGTTAAGFQDFLVSRLTYTTSSYSGEAFARADTDPGVFVKGFVGAGRSASGKMHDEDWLIFDATVPYSNTLSSPVKETLAYATFDVGYALFRGANAKVGGFIGYNYLKDNNSAFGCAQIATPNSVCSPSIPDNVLVITQNNDWHSVRLGLNGVVGLGNGITLTGDAAYLPYVRFSGVDNHLLRSDVPDTVSKEQGFGQGVQLEALLAYTFNQSFSVGAGGRYWAMWANTDANTNIFGTPCPCQTLPSRTERYGGFLQASYKFNVLK